MSFKDRVVITSLKVLPQKLMSHCAGVLMGLELPGPMARASVRTFARLAGANVDEARDPIESFPSVQKFFTRALKDGLRPIDEDDAAFVSPCDGAWGACGPIEDGTLLQVKGRRYSVAALLDDPELAKKFDGGQAMTLYLGPKDYHRFHTPCAGDVVGARYVPGALWPVNNAGITFVDGLFSKNERIIALLRPDQRPDGMIAMIAVGATMVGKVRVVFDDLTTNTRAGGASVVRAYDPPQRLEKGAEWGNFEFGSTIVIVATPGVIEPRPEPPGTRLVLGTRVASFK